MFGLDKILGGNGLLGSFFDKIGMSWMNQVISLAVNVSTGNWLAAAQDVFSLVSQFSSNSWQSRVAQQPPLGPFGASSGFGSNFLPESRANELNTRARSSDPSGTRSYTNTFSVVDETIQNKATANRNREYAQGALPA